MPNIDTMKTSNYLKKEDVGAGTLVTIKGMREENIAKDNSPEELKWLIYFNEFQKPLVSNVTHREQIATYLNSRESDAWTGKQVVLWNDPSVVFQGKVGAVRVRPAQLANNAPPQPNDFNQTPPDYDNIPGFD